MIREEYTRYSSCNVARLSMPDGEQWTFHQMGNNDAHMVVYLSGKTECVAADDTAYVGRVFEGVAFVHDVRDSNVTLRALGDAAWICVSTKEGGAEIIEHAVIDGDFQLPAGTGMIVIAGEVFANDIWVGLNVCFKPREFDVPVHGTAQIILFR